MSYFEWLCRRVCDDSDLGVYSVLLHKLFSKEYYYVNQLDFSRDIDGRELRTMYDMSSFAGYDIPPNNQPASVLEVLVAITDRIIFQMCGFVRNNSRRRWFWEMIRNLDLTRFNDRWDGSWEEIDEILDRWMAGEGDGLGRGTPFPIEDKDGLVGELVTNVTNLDLFYQFQAYAQKRYF